MSTITPMIEVLISPESLAFRWAVCILGFFGILAAIFYKIWLEGQTP